MKLAESKSHVIILFNYSEIGNERIFNMDALNYFVVNKLNVFASRFCFNDDVIMLIMNCRKQYKWKRGLSGNVWY